MYVLFPTNLHNIYQVKHLCCVPHPLHSVHEKSIDLKVYIIFQPQPQCLLSSDATADNTNDRIKVRMRSLDCTPQLRKIILQESRQVSQKSGEHSSCNQY